MSDDLEESINMSPRHFVGIGNWPHVMNMANSIIGVSVLALPFCFKECGILLGFLLLMGSAWLTQLTCHLLMKSAITTKKRSYEYLALYIFGRTGKLVVELSIIGLLIGTCIAFYIIIGDLGPAVVSKVTGLENTSHLRTFLLIFLTVVIVLPLAMLHNLESLSNLSAISLSFYCVFVAEVVIAAFPNLWSGIWLSKVVFWNAEGVFKCIPIFALSFACQTQLFLMSDSLPEPSLNRVNRIVRSAIFMCATIYVSVGFFGYVAFCDDYISGDILMNFRPTFFSEAIKLGFVTSTLISFPLVIFPCRASLYTLLFVQKSVHENFGGAVYIPGPCFKVITVSIVVVTLTIGILVPNVEFMLGLTGATMGSLICYILPAALFIMAISVDSGNTRSFAQLVLLIGVTILLASSYVTLTGPERLERHDSVVKLGQPIQHHEDDLAIHDDEELKKKLNEMIDQRPDQEHVNFAEQVEIKGVSSKAVELPLPVVKEDAVNADVDKNKPFLQADGKELEKDKRQEPPNPHAPLEESVVQEKVEDINSPEKDLHINQSESEKKENADIKGEGLQSPKVPGNPPKNFKNASGVVEVVPLDENLRPELAKVLPSKDRGLQLPSDSGQISDGIKGSVMALNGEKQHVLHKEKIVHRSLDVVPEGSLRYDPTNRVESRGVPEVQPHQKQRKQIGENETLESDPQVQPHLRQGIPAEALPEVEAKGVERNEANILLAELRKQNEEQRKLLDEHRKIIDDLKRHQIEAHQELAPRKDVPAVGQEKLKLVRDSLPARQPQAELEEKPTLSKMHQNHSEKEYVGKKRRAAPELQAQTEQAKPNKSSVNLPSPDAKTENVKLEHLNDKIAENKSILKQGGSEMNSRNQKSGIIGLKDAKQKKDNLSNNKTQLENVRDAVKPLADVTLGADSKEMFDVDKQLFDQQSLVPNNNIVRDLSRSRN